MARKYLIKIPFYRQGVLYPPGSIVEVADGEGISVTWTEVTEPPTGNSAAPPEAPTELPSTSGRGRRRAADGEPTAS